MTAHAPSAVGVAKAPPPLILFNYIKLQWQTKCYELIPWPRERRDSGKVPFSLTPHMPLVEF